MFFQNFPQLLIIHSTTVIGHMVLITIIIIIINIIIIIIIIIIIVSMTKCSIVIGSLRASLIRNWRVIKWVSNYSCPI